MSSCSDDSQVDFPSADGWMTGWLESKRNLIIVFLFLHFELCISRRDLPTVSDVGGAFFLVALVR
jgi:hypothetical protein